MDFGLRRGFKVVILRSIDFWYLGRIYFLLLLPPIVFVINLVLNLTWLLLVSLRIIIVLLILVFDELKGPLLIAIIGSAIVTLRLLLGGDFPLAYAAVATSLFVLVLFICLNFQLLLKVEVLLLRRDSRFRLLF